MTRRLFFVLLMCLLVVPIYADVTLSSTSQFCAPAALCPVGVTTTSSLWAWNTTVKGYTDSGSVGFDGVTSLTQAESWVDLGTVTLTDIKAQYSTTLNENLYLDVNFSTPKGETSFLYPLAVTVTTGTGDELVMSIADLPGPLYFYTDKATDTYYYLNVQGFTTSSGSTSTTDHLSATPGKPGTAFLYGTVTTQVPEVGSIALLGLFLGASALITRKVRA